MNLLTLLLQTTDTLVTPPVLTPTVETAGDLNLWELAFVDIVFDPFHKRIVFACGSSDDLQPFEKNVDG